jgi:hypothetical protein
MAKKFMYVCLGMLALVAAFHLGAQYGQAGYVDHSGGEIIALLDTQMHDYPKVLLANGEIWAYEFDLEAWVFSPEEHWPSCPVPTSQIKFIDDHDVQWFISTSDELWYHNWDVGWVNAGSPSGGIATQSTTWSEIKARFGE